MTHPYRSMQAMRQLSAAQRTSTEARNSLLVALCLKLERRMLQQKVYCQEMGCSTRYGQGGGWKFKLRLTQPLQDGNALLKIIQDKMKQYERIHTGDKLLNPDLRALCVYVTDFLPEDQLQYHLFEDEVKRGKLRRLQFDINQRYGSHSLMRATELSHGRVLRDAIGFGSVKDLIDIEEAEEAEINSELEIP
jgi:DNA polymerase-4